MIEMEDTNGAMKTFASFHENLASNEIWQIILR